MSAGIPTIDARSLRIGLSNSWDTDRETPTLFAFATTRTDFNESPPSEKKFEFPWMPLTSIPKIFAHIEAMKYSLEDSGKTLLESKTCAN
jgi:hypothetical protein